MTATPPIPTLRDRIRTELARQGHSAYWLALGAERAGIASQSMVYQWLAGRNDIRSDTASRLAGLLGIAL